MAPRLVSPAHQPTRVSLSDRGKAAYPPEILGQRDVSSEYDVIVVGARVAGSVAAAMLGVQGRRVLLVEKAAAGTSTVSTHFFRGGGLGDVLQRLGVMDQILALGTPPLVRQWNYAGGTAEGQEGPPQSPGDLGYCLSVRRGTLDAILAKRASDEPCVDYAPATAARRVLFDRSRAAGVEIDGPGRRREVGARLIIGADGRRSLVARQVGAQNEEQESGHRSLFYRYVRGWTSSTGDTPDAAEFSLIDDELAYVFPSDSGWTCIAISVGRAQANGLKSDLSNGFDELLRRHRGLAPRLDACCDQSRMFGGPTGMNFVREPWGLGWLLVGDAGQHQDPWTGVGMDLAGATAAAAARHVGRWLDGSVDEQVALSDWRTERDGLGRETWAQTVQGSRHLSGGG